MEKDNFTDVQLDKTELPEELFYQSRDMYRDKRPKEFKLMFVVFFPNNIFFNFSDCFKWNRRNTGLAKKQAKSIKKTNQNCVIKEFWTNRQTFA